MYFHCTEYPTTLCFFAAIEMIAKTSRSTDYMPPQKFIGIMWELHNLCNLLRRATFRVSTPNLRISIQLHHTNQF